jgi:hypothetical protein
MSIQLATAAYAISRLVVEDLTIGNIDKIPLEVGSRSAYLIPHPNYVSDVLAERDSYGGASALMTMHYTLTYRLCYAPAGSDRAMSIELYDDMIKMVTAIWDAFLNIGVLDADISEVVDILPYSITNMGIVNDPADRAFYGCDLAFRVTEFVR